jgi:hypothetical protein
MFHSDFVHESVKNISTDEEIFGLLKMKMSKVNITNKPTMILFTIDATGSMNDCSSKRSSKVEIVKHSFKNIVRYLSKQDAPIYIAVHTFNDNIDVILDTIQINESNVNDAIEKINSIEADGPTNIELALKNAKDFINKYRLDNPEHQVAHIFMTDGHPSTGSFDSETLKQLVKENDSGNVFIGFGSDHNLTLLKTLSENKRSYYQYINNFEDTSCIYGELIHPYLFPCIENVKICVDNGLIYNWKTNTWTDQLDEDILVSESEKIYHIRKTDEDLDVVVDIYGTTKENQQYDIIEQIHEIPDLINMDTNEIERVDLTPYMFRQKTQELLFKCTQTDLSLGNFYDDDEIKKQFRALFDEIAVYMKETNKIEDPFMKQLCDDLHVTYRSINSYEFGMTSMSRFTSQGRQQTNVYTPKLDEDRFSDDGYYNNVPILNIKNRTHNYRSVDSGFDILDSFSEQETQKSNVYSIDTYEIAERSTSCYKNRSVLETITQIENY